MKTRTLLLAASLFLGATAGAQAKDVARMVTVSASRNGVPVSLAQAVTRVESGYRCHMVGAAGELGPMQVKPATARLVGIFGNLRHCETGIEAGVRYLRAALTRAGGHWGHAAALYNGGLGARPRITAYSRRVLAQAGYRTTYTGFRG